MPLCEFQQPFDGTQPPVDASEQAIVKARFVNMVGSVILQHIDQVAPWPISIGSSSEWVHLRDPKGYKGLLVNIVREELSERSHHWIMLQTDDGNSSDYMTDPETGVVVRYDNDPSLSLEASFHASDSGDIEYQADDDYVEPSEEESREILAENMQKLGTYLTNEWANQDLDKAMGLNQQPVGLVEIEHLQELVESAKPVRD